MKATHSFARSINAVILQAGLLSFCADAVAQIRLQSYDTPAIIELEYSAIRASEGTNTVRVNLFRTGEFREYTRVEFTTAEQTASEGVDYKAAGGTVVFQPGEGFKTIELQILTDSEMETEERFELKLTADSPDTIITRDTVAITIEDVPAVAPRLVIAPAPGLDAAIKLSWESPVESVLERNVNPVIAPWEPVTGAVILSGTRHEVVENTRGAKYFYRLRMP